MRKIDLTRWEVYFQLRDGGKSVEAAARGSKIDPKTAWRFERGEPGSTGVEAAKALGVDAVAGSEVAPEVTREAREALEDFEAFRLRYFGRVSTPWQAEAAETLADLLDTPDREYCAVNVPPGAGKSTLFTHDVPAWLIARDRSIRILFGSRTERQAKLYSGRIKKTLERTVPMSPGSDLVSKGMAFEAASTLANDYGAFKPEGRTDLWRADQLVARQFGGGPTDDDKEPTVSAFGAESGFLGGRYDFVIWDDLIDKKNIAGEALERLMEDWVTEFETRVEPGGLMVLQGQRMGSKDLYRQVLDMADMEGKPKYHHVKFPAHFDDRCKEHHGGSSRPPPPYPAGCLLDPHRLPWKFLSNIKATTPRVYDIQYQQNDGQAAAQVFKMAYIDGGKDDEGLDRPGCLDHDRPHGTSQFEPYSGWSVLSVDPSPSMWWGLTWWVMRPDQHKYEVVEIHRKKMSSEGFLSIDMESSEFSGLAEEIRCRALAQGHPLHVMILEVNAAQKFLLAQPHMQLWGKSNAIQLMPHTTAINKAHPEYGVTGMVDFFKQGAIRLPWGDTLARGVVATLARELTAWPEGDTSDLVMSMWFAIRAVQLSYADPGREAPRFDRPGWLGEGRGIDSLRREEKETDMLPFRVRVKASA